MDLSEQHKKNVTLSAHSNISVVIPSKIIQLSHCLQGYSNFISCDLQLQKDDAIHIHQTNNKSKKAGCQSVKRKTKSNSKILNKCDHTSESSENETDDDIICSINSKCVISYLPEARVLDAKLFHNVNKCGIDYNATKCIDELVHKLKTEIPQFINSLRDIDFFVGLTLNQSSRSHLNGDERQIFQIAKHMCMAAQESAQQFLNQIPQYYDKRGRLVEKIDKLKNLTIGDSFRAIGETDNKQLLLFTNSIRELRNTYWVIYHLLQSCNSFQDKPKYIGL